MCTTQAPLLSGGTNLDSWDILILRWIQTNRCGFLAVEYWNPPGPKDEVMIVEQVVLSAETPPGYFFHLASYHLTLYEFFTHHASCTLQVQPHGRWPPPNQTSWSSCWASWWKRGTCFIRWGREELFSTCRILKTWVFVLFYWSNGRKPFPTLKLGFCAFTFLTGKQTQPTHASGTSQKTPALCGHLQFGNRFYVESSK